MQLRTPIEPHRGARMLSGLDTGGVGRAGRAARGGRRGGRAGVVSGLGWWAVRVGAG